VFNSDIRFTVAGVAGSVKNSKNGDGDEIKSEIQKVKLVTSDISYDQIKEFNPKIYDLLAQHAPIEFDGLTFKNVAESVKIKVFKENDENKMEYEFKDVNIRSLVIKNDKKNPDIPIYSFVLEIPLYEKSGSYFLNGNLKSVIVGVFS